MSSRSDPTSNIKTHASQILKETCTAPTQVSSPLNSQRICKLSFLSEIVSPINYFHNYVYLTCLPKLKPIFQNVFPNIYFFEITSLVVMLFTLTLNRALLVVLANSQGRNCMIHLFLALKILVGYVLYMGFTVGLSSHTI